MVLASSTALAGKSARGNPPIPTNFHVTAITAYIVALAWDPAPANSGDFNYHLWGAYNVEPTVILPKTATSYTFTGLYPGNYYTFGIYAKNASGNASTQVILSNVRTLSDTTPANPNDDTPPNTPTFVSAYGFGDRSTEMQIQWAQSSDDFDAQSNIRYDVYVNGVLENVRFGHRLRSIRRKHDRSLRLGYSRQ